MTYSIDFDHDAVEAASHWHGGQASMLYALASTGTLSRGTIRPQHHTEDRPMTDAEWLIDLAERLRDEASDSIASAEKQIADSVSSHDEDEHDELLADVEGLQSIVDTCDAFLERARPLLAIDATLPRYADGTLARYTSVGSYTIVYRLADGGCLCADCANGRNGSEAYVLHDDKQWQIIGADTYDEGPPLHCDHCNAEIESSYGDPDADKEEA